MKKMKWAELKASDCTLVTNGEKTTNQTKVEVKVNARSLSKKLDTGPGVSSISEATKGNSPHQATDLFLILRRYTIEFIQLIGEMLVEGTVQQDADKLSLIGDGCH